MKAKENILLFLYAKILSHQTVALHATFFLLLKLHNLHIIFYYSEMIENTLTQKANARSGL